MKHTTILTVNVFVISLAICPLNTHIYIMERRGFLQILGAFGLAPAVPSIGPAMALAPVSSAPIAGAAYNHHMFGHALAVIRTKGVLSIAEFQSTMHFTAAQTELMLGDLASKGMISNGFSASGVLNAVKPNWFAATSNTQAVRAFQAVDNKPKNIKQALDKLTEEAVEEHVDIEEETDAET